MTDYWPIEICPWPRAPAPQPSEGLWTAPRAALACRGTQGLAARNDFISLDVFGQMEGQRRSQGRLRGEGKPFHLRSTAEPGLGPQAWGGVRGSRRSGFLDPEMRLQPHHFTPRLNTGSL